MLKWQSPSAVSSTASLYAEMQDVLQRLDQRCDPRSCGKNKEPSQSATAAVASLALLLARASSGRRHRVLLMPATAPNTASPMLLSDILLGYYIRRLQLSVVSHVCCIGYCRQSWNEPCKFGLPATEVVTQMRTDDDAVRMVPRKTNLDDDAFNKTTSLAVLALTGMNVQINQHHPHGGHKGMLYSLKYSLKELVFGFWV